MALQTDYLIKGGGASAMGFLDAMFHHSQATFTVVDRDAAPGGHWNHAYPFARLHQPHDFYGLASRPLGDDRIDLHGTNAGLVNLPSGTQVANHYQRAMEEVFLPSGRVVYHPMSQLNDDGEIVSLLSGKRQQTEVRRRVVDATHLETAIPLTHRRSFEVAAGVHCIPPNDLPRSAPGHARFVVIGGGKTGLDCVSWLLDRGAEPTAITWVVSRDAWWSNRRALQSAGPLRCGSLEMLYRQSEVMAQAASVAAYCDGMEQCQAWLRVDTQIGPTMYHAATVTQAELQRLGDLGSIVRSGKLLQIEPGRMTLQGGCVDVPAGALHIDCSASALSANRLDRTPVFSPGRIDLQFIRFPGLCLSAALTGIIEALVESDAEKQGMTQVAPMIDTVEDWIDRSVVNAGNQQAWMGHDAVRAWLGSCRLDAVAAMMRAVPADDVLACRWRDRLRELAPAVAANMRRLRAPPNLPAAGRQAPRGG